MTKRFIGIAMILTLAAGLVFAAGQADTASAAKPPLRATMNLPVWLKNGVTVGLKLRYIPGRSWAKNER